MWRSEAMLGFLRFRGIGGRGASSGARLMDSAVMNGYKAELREFRALQEELEPWTAAFKAKHGRKPCLADVENTRAPQDPIR